MLDDAKFRGLYSRVFQWFHGVGVEPTVQERQVYELAVGFHGFLVEDEGAFDPTVLSVLVRACYKPVDPVFFFIPPVRLAWALSRTQSLCKAAVRRAPATKSLIQEALGRVCLSTPPWEITSEPKNWASFGFGRNADKILPQWCLDGLAPE